MRGNGDDVIVGDFSRFRRPPLWEELRIPLDPPYIGFKDLWVSPHPPPPRSRDVSHSVSFLGRSACRKSKRLSFYDSSGEQRLFFILSLGTPATRHRANSPETPSSASSESFHYFFLSSAPK